MPASVLTPMMPSSRTLAGLAAWCVLAGASTVAIAVIASQGAFYRGYVSEAGVVGQPYWIVYRIGILGLAGGLVLLAGAMRSILRSAASLLLVSGLLAGASGSISCSEGCPLPPLQTPTIRDLVHGGTSVAGVALCALAVLLVAVFGPAGGLRRASRVAIAPIVAAGLVNAYALAFVGRGDITGVVERVLLVLMFAWCLAAAYALSRSGRDVSGPSR